MSSELFEDVHLGNDIQIIHFVAFSSDKAVCDNFDKNSNVGDILVELVVPKDCWNACCYREPLYENTNL